MFIDKETANKLIGQLSGDCMRLLLSGRQFGIKVTISDDSYEQLKKADHPMTQTVLLNLWNSDGTKPISQSPDSGGKPFRFEKFE